MRRFASVLLALALVGCAGDMPAAEQPARPAPPPGAAADGLIDLPHVIGRLGPVQLTLLPRGKGLSYQEVCVSGGEYRGEEVFFEIDNPGGDDGGGGGGSMGSAGQPPVMCAPGQPVGAGSTDDRLRDGGTLRITFKVRHGNGSIDTLTRSYVQDDEGRLWLKP